MCVAVYKPAGVQAPNLDTLKACWVHNPDGAGIGYTTTNNKFALCKGLMKWKQFEKKIKDLGDLTGAQVFYHFRIATHGSIRPGNCHPFPVSTSLKQLQATSGVFDRVLMHNGILPITPLLKDTSDSQELARRLAVFKTSQQFRNALDLLEGFEEGSKIAVWDNGSVRLLGTWNLVDGVYYSNLLWQGGPRYFGNWWREDDDGYCYSGSWNSSKWPTNGKSAKDSAAVLLPNEDYDDTDVIDAGVNTHTSQTLHIPAKAEEVFLIRDYGVCPDCHNELEEVNMTDDTAYCAYCDIEWEGNFK